MKTAEIRERLAENIRRFRVARKMTQTQLAEQAGLSADTVKSLEQGRAGLGEKSLAAISTALGIDAVHLFMPLDEAFAVQGEDMENIRQAIASGLRAYMDSALDDLLKSPAAASPEPGYLKK